uniref:MFS domain-containing protein n=1 Tax=Caenorhabditis tropicalis TaxID=1561998 RepID=A0A1I7T1N4_9PELO
MDTPKSSTSSGTTSRRFELLCVMMLTFGQLCIMTGYDSQSFILESVIHSIHEREPERISPYAGYYGQAVCYLAYVTACLFSPSFLYATSAKTTLLISSICFTSFPLGFLFTNSYYYYFSSALNGIGFAFYYTGNGGYITSHSTRQSIESNVSLSWSFGCCCMIVGSIIMAIITTVTQAPDILPEVLNATIPSGHGIERRFGDSEIYLLFSVFAAISSLAIFTFMMMPSQDVSNCIESSEKHVTFRDGMKLMADTLTSSKMFKLAPTFLLTGIHTSFWLSVFPTTLTFNMHNSKLIYLPAIYGFGVGVGETIMGIIISTLSKRIKDFGLKPTMLIGCVLTTVFCFLALISTPFNATVTPSNEEPLLFQPNRVFVFMIALIGGMSDCCLCSVRSVICALAMPKRRAQAFSVSKIYQSLGTCVIFFISPFLNLYHYVFGIPILCSIACIFFFRQAGQTQVMERKITQELEEAEKRRIAKELEAMQKRV